MSFWFGDAVYDGYRAATALPTIEVSGPSVDPDLKSRPEADINGFADVTGSFAGKESKAAPVGPSQRRLPSARVPERARRGAPESDLRVRPADLYNPAINQLPAPIELGERTPS